MAFDAGASEALVHNAKGTPTPVDVGGGKARRGYPNMFPVRWNRLFVPNDTTSGFGDDGGAGNV